MRDRGRSPRITPPQAEALSGSEFHDACGKFCAQVTGVASKALFCQGLFGFEPKRSSSPKARRMIELSRFSENPGHSRGDGFRGAALYAISTGGLVGERHGFSGERR